MALTMCDSDNILRDYIHGNVKETGQKWRNDPRNPVNDPGFTKETVDKWDEFVRNWVSDKNLPLLIRKRDFDLGTRHLHNSGRELVPVDNSPAQWVFACVCNGLNPPNDVIVSLRLDREGIPIAMIVPAATRGTDAYRGRLASTHNTQTYGWYLAHKKPVALGGKILDATIDELEVHFLKLMSPLNMFLVPNDKNVAFIPFEKRMSTLSDQTDFINQQ